MSLLLFPLILSAAGEPDTVTSASVAASVVRQRLEGRTETLSVGDARIQLFVENQPFELDHRELHDWVMHSAEIVADYFDGFPVAEVHILILGGRGNRVMSGRTVTASDAVVNVRVGLGTTTRALKDDWIMVHELIHLAFPSVARRHHWIEEGLATYVESIARANAGDLDREIVWAGFLDGMPKGLPRDGDRGLDNTPTWGRTYWGGALFFLNADLRIRQATGGRRSLRDALRGVVKAGYNMRAEAEIRHVLQTADAATGVNVLSELYDEMRASPVPQEIDSLWKNLGISEMDGRIVFDDEAPLSDYRDALTSTAPW